MDYVHVFVLRDVVSRREGDVRSRNVAATFDIFEAEDHRNKGVENDYETFVVPCDWREDAATPGLITAMRNFRSMVEKMQVRRFDEQNDN